MQTQTKKENNLEIFVPKDIAIFPQINLSDAAQEMIFGIYNPLVKPMALTQRHLQTYAFYDMPIDNAIVTRRTKGLVSLSTIMNFDVPNIVSRIDSSIEEYFSTLEDFNQDNEMFALVTKLVELYTLREKQFLSSDSGLYEIHRTLNEALVDLATLAVPSVLLVNVKNIQSFLKNTMPLIGTYVFAKILHIQQEKNK